MSRSGDRIRATFPDAAKAAKAADDFDESMEQVQRVMDTRGGIRTMETPRGVDLEQLYDQIVDALEDAAFHDEWDPGDQPSLTAAHDLAAIITKRVRSGAQGGPSLEVERLADAEKWFDEEGWKAIPGFPPADPVLEYEQKAEAIVARLSVGEETKE